MIKGSFKLKKKKNKSLVIFLVSQRSADLLPCQSANKTYSLMYGSRERLPMSADVKKTQTSVHSVGICNERVQKTSNR